MRNIRELAFFRSFVDAEHWDAIVALPSLEELSFHLCQFLKGPADLEPAKRVRVKPSRLSMVGSTGFRQPLAAIDVRYLRALTTDTLFFKLVDSLPQSLEALALLIDDSLELDLVPWMLYELVWKNLTLLQSFTLRIRTLNPIEVRQLSSLSVSCGSLTRTLGPLLSRGGCWFPHTSAIIYTEKLRDHSGDLIRGSSTCP